MELEGYSELIKITKGGMATVYKAEQLSLNRTVAIKFLSAELLWDQEANTLFDQESLVIAQLDHPNIIHIIDRGVTPRRRPYFVMQYINGHDISQLAEQQPLSLEEKLKILLQICKGMAFAHKNGVIHRDIKPANILIDNEMHVYILDFGIALLASSGHPENIVGTPDYMSPEQFKDPASVTHLSDIFSLGVVMYELFMSELPAAHFDNLAASLTSLSPALSELIAQCLETDPDKRPASADAIGLRLLKIMQGAHIEIKQRAEAVNVMANIKNKFSLLDVIKHTKFGSVYLFEDQDSHQLFVVKKRIKTEAGYQQARKLKHILHPNIIRVLGTSINDNAFIIVMEHLSGGSLQDRLVRRFKQKSFLVIARQICKAMIHAHQHKILHANLRPSNILFNEKNNIVLTDFGLDEHYATSDNETNWYQRTDLSGASVKRDIYSAGAIFYHMLTGTPVILINGKIKSDSAFASLSSPLQSLLEKMLEKTPTQFQNFKEILSELKVIPDAPSADRLLSVFNTMNVLVVLFIINILLIVGYLFFNPTAFITISHFIKNIFS